MKRLKRKKELQKQLRRTDEFPGMSQSVVDAHKEKCQQETFSRDGMIFCWSIKKCRKAACKTDRK